MFDLVDELRGIVGIFDGASIAYALAGGLAVSIYATPRATQDIDILVAVTDLDRAVTALHDLDFRTAGRPMAVADGRLEIQRLIKIDGSDLLPLDLLLARDPELTSVLTERREIAWEGTRLSIVTVDGLRRLKRLRSARARLRMTGADVSAALGTVSALRRLCLRLPHVPTATELGLLERFREIVEAPEQATEYDLEAVLAGWSSWWREGKVADLAAMERRFPRRVIESDRRLATLAMAARTSTSQS